MPPLTHPIPTVKPRWLGRVAQLVERGIENPCVGGSIPSPATAAHLFAEVGGGRLPMVGASPLLGDGWARRAPMPRSSWWGLALLLALGVTSGCGDNCEQLCVQTANQLAACKPDSLSWNDLGARSKSDFAGDCRTDWERVSADLTVSDLRVALDVCDEASGDLFRLSCEELTALYAVEE